VTRATLLFSGCLWAACELARVYANRKPAGVLGAPISTGVSDVLILPAGSAPASHLDAERDRIRRRRTGRSIEINGRGVPGLFWLSNPILRVFECQGPFGTEFPRTPTWNDYFKLSLRPLGFPVEVTFVFQHVRDSAKLAGRDGTIIRLQKGTR
jgi:hypothetical protein